ncbi:MAG TPA: hypothetical protein VLJ15_00490 [Gammaproteobacteria bacterium]|nr:hypothetical protein [Gammaproteobacteria bacterium]
MKKMLIAFALFAVASGAFAEPKQYTCPPVSAWSHVKGQPWVLKAADGWRAEDQQDQHAINSKQTSLDKFTDVSVHAATMQGFYCRYATGEYYDGNQAVIVAMNGIMLPELSALDPDVFTPAKDEGGGYLESTCKASNPKALNLCAWTWG